MPGSGTETFLWGDNFRDPAPFHLWSIQDLKLEARFSPGIDWMEQPWSWWICTLLQWGYIWSEVSRCQRGQKCFQAPLRWLQTQFSKMGSDFGGSTSKGLLFWGQALSTPKSETRPLLKRYLKLTTQKLKHPKPLVTFENVGLYLHKSSHIHPFINTIGVIWMGDIIPEGYICSISGHPFTL